MPSRLVSCLALIWLTRNGDLNQAGMKYRQMSGRPAPKRRASTLHRCATRCGEARRAVIGRRAGQGLSARQHEQPFDSRTKR
jgi:hypothetical protein